MATLAQQLDAMLELRPNWDGYGADPVSVASVTWAKDFLGYFTSLERTSGHSGNVRVYPTRVGGVQIEWDDIAAEWELELNPDGSLGLLRVDKETGAMSEETFHPGHEAVAIGFLTRLGELAETFSGAA